MEGSHTSEKIAETLIETKRKWSLPENVTATTDNAANEKKAFQLLNWERFGCYGHRINLIVRHALNVPEVNKLLTKARKLVTFFHTSLSCSDLLKMKQQLQFPPPSPKASHKLIMDVVTRWNSTLAMLHRVVELMPAIVALVNDDSISLSKSASATIKTHAFSFDEIALAEKIAAVLQHFKNATDILCAENSPTMHKVLPVVVKLSRELKENENDPPEIKALKMNMNSELLKRTESEDIALTACVLNPYTKGFEFMPERREEAHMLLRRLAIGVDVVVKKETEENNNIQLVPTLPVMPEEPEEAEVVTDEPPPKMRKLKSADTEDWLDDVVCTGESTIDKQTLIEKELNTYFISKVEPNMTVLEWWKSNENMYPRLSKLAKKFLCCPASSVPSERVFSLAGNIVNKKRSRLSPENVDMFIYLNKNIKQYW